MYTELLPGNALVKPVNLYPSQGDWSKVAQRAGSSDYMFRDIPFEELI
jgi:hypothetical protein